ncbi:unnamed protein product [Symbiodinium sp. CCMP2592]|nr:unnamed protein product [Symbiodinium sp. CCMP2592]
MKAAWQLSQGRIYRLGPQTSLQVRDHCCGEPQQSPGWHVVRDTPRAGLPINYGSVTSCFVLASVSRTATRGRHCRCKRKPSSSPVSGSTRLLVDADIHSVEEIEDVIKELEKTCRAVYTTVFAEPRRIENKRWDQLFQRRRIMFQPVERNSSRVAEANDAVIDRAIRTCANDQSLALLTSDYDYVEAVKDAMNASKRVLVFVPSKKTSLIIRYQSAGVEVQRLHRRVSALPRVRAFLHQDGSGHVQLSDPYDPYSFVHDEDTVDAFTSFLADLGFLATGDRDKEYFVQSTAKFWVTNELGSTVVFPAQIGMNQVLEQMRKSSNMKWRRYDSDMAFFLPKTSRRKLTKKQMGEFGTGISKEIFSGGGPFLLNDSTDLVCQALRRLGYMDNDMNADLQEAMLVFVNAPTNKYNLRKPLDVLPSPTDTAAEVEDKLRYAFLSHRTNGQWRVAPKDVQIRAHLCKLGFLADVNSARRDVFRAMAKYARRHQLPEMKTYNGYVFRLMDYMDSSPTKTGAIEIRQSGD